MICHEIDPDGEVFLVYENPQPAVTDQEDVEEYPSNTPTEVDAAPDAAPEAEPVYAEIRVSSKHLMLASPYFRRALDGNLEEGTTLRGQGSVRLRQGNGDLEAMLIIMNIFHHRTRSVPRVISLEMLARIAILVDIYECHEALEMFTDTWILVLRSTMPVTFTKSAVLWLGISSVFGRSSEFCPSTILALEHSKGPIETYGLPIAHSVIGNGFVSSHSKNDVLISK